MSTAVVEAPVVALDEDESPRCTSAVRHDCSHLARWDARGDGERVLWCQGRYEDWLWERSRLRCRCGQPQTHWRVTAL